MATIAQATLAGRPSSPGLGIKHLLWLPPSVPGPTTATKTPSGAAGVVRDPSIEKAHLRTALDAASTKLSSLARDTASQAGDEIEAIFEAQALFATDPGIVEPTLAAIDAGADAAKTIESVTAEQADKLAGIEDKYFRERAADLRDVGQQIVDQLLEHARPALHHRDGSPAIVASDDLDPSVVTIIRPKLVAELALAGRAQNGHAAIVARALKIPLTLNLSPALDVKLDSIDVAVDETGNRLLIEPTDIKVRALAATTPVSAPTAVGLNAIPDAVEPPVTLEANVGSVQKAEAAAAASAIKIGLVKTKLLFLRRKTPPDLKKQRALYRRITAYLPGRPIVFKTLNISSDKPASYLPAEAEMNPALSIRKLRLRLSRPDLFETQLRALLEADPGSPLRLLLPMVATIDKIAATQKTIAAATAASRRAGAEVTIDVRLEIMVEIPSMAILADAFAPVVDFFSIGTNNLVQYTLAADRTSPALAELATPLQPAILRLIRLVTDAALPYGRPVAVCREAAADPLAAALFVKLSVDELSVAPSSLAGLRATLARIDVKTFREATTRATAASSIAEVKKIAASLVEQSTSSAKPSAA